jgi:hypothetical protein
MSGQFNAFRNPNSNRSGSLTDDGTKDLKNNIRESRWIPSEHWESPKVQQTFEKVKILYLFKKIFILFIFRVLLTFLKYMVCFKN